jgi:hypothetical protein
MTVVPGPIAIAAEEAASRETRLAMLEARLKTLEPKRKDTWEKLQALSPIISGLAVAVVGYFLTGSVTAALQREQVQLSNVKEMRELVSMLASADTTDQSARAAAHTISAFGKPAVTPLVATLAEGHDISAPAAEAGLRALGLSEPEAVCAPLTKMLQNTSGRFTWVAHLSAIRLVGDLECREARAVVSRYAGDADGVRTAAQLQAFATRMRSDPPVDQDAVSQLRQELARTRRVLSGQ